MRPGVISVVVLKARTFYCTVLSGCLLFDSARFSLLLSTIAINALSQAYFELLWTDPPTSVVKANGRRSRSQWIRSLRMIYHKQTVATATRIGVITHADYVGRRGYRIFESVCLSVCLFVCPQHNSKTNDPKVFELGIGNLRIPWEWYCFGVQRSKVKVTGLISAWFFTQMSGA